MKYDYLFSTTYTPVAHFLLYRKLIMGTQKPEY